MTDTCRVNNIYYDCKLYNATTAPINAGTDDTLAYPLLQDSGDYSVAVVKAKIDLSTIPLTSSNIGLKEYQLGLKYGSIETTQYVRQVNSTNNNYVWNCPQGSTTITQYQYTNSTLVSVGTIAVGSVCSYVQSFLVDDYENIYIAGSNTSNSFAETLFVTDNTGTLILTQSYTKIMHIYLDSGQNLYVTDEGLVPKVWIYSNQNSETSVVLTELTTLTTNFAGNPLSNLEFCVADTTIIVGYNANQITIYNSSYQAISDTTLSSVVQFQNTAQIDGKAGTFVVADVNTSNEELVGTSRNFYDLETNTQLTSGVMFDSGSAIVSGFSFGIGSDNHTYVAPFPSGSYPQTAGVANNSTTMAFGCICSNKNDTIYGIDTSQNLQVWNYNVPAQGVAFQNIWQPAGSVFKATNNFINLDYQISTNRIFAVDTSNNLYSSNLAVAPQNIYYNDSNNQMNLAGVWGQNSSGVMETSLIKDYGYSTLNFAIMTRIGDFFYTLSNVATQVSQYNMADFSATGTNYQCTEIGGGGSTPGNLYGIASVKTSSANCFATVGGSHYAYNQVGVYNVAGGAVVSVTPAFPNGDTNGQGNPICDLGDNAHIMVSGTSGFIYIYDITTNPATLTLSYSTGSSPCNTCVANPGDTSSGGVACAFVMVGNTQIVKLGFSAGFASVLTNTLIVNLTGGAQVWGLGCNPNFGKVYYLNSSSLWTVLYQSAGYSNTAPNVSTFQSPTNAGQFTSFIDTDIVNTPTWSQVNTGGFQLTSVNVSRYSPNTLYATGLADNLLYQGTWNSGTNAVTFTRISSYTNTYSYISSRAYSNPTINAKVDCFTISSQATVGTPVSFTGNVASIARDEVTGEYLVANQAGNNLISYNSTTFTQNWSQTLAGVYNIVAKNGEDIDAGPVDIYRVSVYIDAINAAFVLATTQLNQQASINWTPPVLSLDYNTGLCTLTYEAATSAIGNGILFNAPLLSIILYPSTVDTTSGLNLLSLPVGSTTDTQSSKSIYLINQLDKILFLSQTVYVTGSWTGVNESTNIITDIDVPTDTFVENIGQVLYYQPNFLRPYFMQTNLALGRINLNLKYSYEDFSEYQLTLNPNTNFTTKLQFIKKF